MICCWDCFLESYECDRLTIAWFMFPQLGKQDIILDSTTTCTIPCMYETGKKIIIIDGPYRDPVDRVCQEPVLVQRVFPLHQRQLVGHHQLHQRLLHRHHHSGHPESPPAHSPLCDFYRGVGGGGITIRGKKGKWLFWRKKTVTYIFKTDLITVFSEWTNNLSKEKKFFLLSMISSHFPPEKNTMSCVKVSCFFLESVSSAPQDNSLFFSFSSLLLPVVFNFYVNVMIKKCHLLLLTIWITTCCWPKNDPDLYPAEQSHPCWKWGVTFPYDPPPPPLLLSLLLPPLDPLHAFSLISIAVF